MFPVGPVITVLPALVSTVSPDNAVLVCTAMARPRPSITWMRGGISINSTAGVYDIVDHEMGERELTSVLTLLRTEPKDAGDYVCQAELAPYFALVDIKIATLYVRGN